MKPEQIFALAAFVWAMNALLWLLLRTPVERPPGLRPKSIDISTEPDPVYCIDCGHTLDGIEGGLRCDDCRADDDEAYCESCGDDLHDIGPDERRLCAVCTEEEFGDSIPEDDPEDEAIGSCENCGSNVYRSDYGDGTLCEDCEWQASQFGEDDSDDWIALD